MKDCGLLMTDVAVVAAALEGVAPGAGGGPMVP